jgi:hypothetical protein
MYVSENASRSWYGDPQLSTSRSVRISGMTYCFFMCRPYDVLSKEEGEGVGRLTGYALNRYSLTENTPHLHYKHQLVNAVRGVFRIMFVTLTHRICKIYFHSDTTFVTHRCVFVQVEFVSARRDGIT